MDIDNIDKNDTSAENNSTKNDLKNKGMINIHSLMDLKKYESVLFYSFVMSNKKVSLPGVVDLAFLIIETIQVFSLFYNEYYLPNMSSGVRLLFNIVNLRNLINPLILVIAIGALEVIVYTLFIINFFMGFGSRKFPNWLLSFYVVLVNIVQNLLVFPIYFALFDFFDCSKDENDTNAKYICFNSDHIKISILSLVVLFFYLSFAYIVTVYNETYVPLTEKMGDLSSCDTHIIFRRISALEYLNIFFVGAYLKQPVLSTILMICGWLYILYHHFIHQYHYTPSLNYYFSSLWISILLTHVVNLFFLIFKIKQINFIFYILTFVGLVLGWVINSSYSNWYTKKIINNIKRKYNQQHVISRLKEQLEMENVNNDERRSLDTIVTERRVIKKEKVFKRVSDCAFVSRFITINRSLEAFNLVIYIFKEGLNQFDRDPEYYIQYWYYLHGMRKFIVLNRKCYAGSEAEEFLRKINYLSEKVLTKSANLAKTLVQKYLVYNAVFVYEIDKQLLSNRDNKGSNSTNDFELAEIRNTSIQYHIASLNAIKNLMSSLRILDNPTDIDNAMKLNDELTELLHNGESIFKTFVQRFNYDRESLELYILFLRNSMNRGDLAEQYIQILEENEHADDNEDEQEATYKKYEKSEKASSMASDIESKKSRILKKNTLNRCQQPLYKLLRVIQIVTTIAIVIGIIGNVVYIQSFNKIIESLNLFTIASQAPSIMCSIKNSVRDISLLAAGGFPPMKFAPYFILTNTLQFLQYVYIPKLYHMHSIKPSGINTVHPVDFGIVDELKDVNYFSTMMKIERKAVKVVEKLNLTSIIDPQYMYDRDVRYFTANLKGQFGKLFLTSVDLYTADIKRIIGRHETIFFVILISIVVFMTFIVTQIVIPNSNKSSKFIKNIICLYKTLPAKYLQESSNDYMDQVKEICENYDVEDEGIGKTDKKRKHSTSYSVKKTFVLYCIFISILLLIPFITVFFYSQDSKNLITFLTYSTKRGYYVNSINHLCEETIIKDRFYYSEGEELRMLNDYYNTLQTLETNLKNGKYGGKQSTDYAIFDRLNNNPGCVRGQYLLAQCSSRTYDNVYTEELANSPLDYIMVEYLNKLKDYINNMPEQKYDLTNQMSIKMLNVELLNNEYLKLFKNLGNDIGGHVTVMNELGVSYLLGESTKYINYTLISHAICSTLIFITFYFFVSRPIKQQLRVVDSLTNLTFSIPTSIYNSSPKIKSFIENGKIDE